MISNSKLILTITLFLLSSLAWGKLKVITTTTNIRSLVSEVGGDLVDVESLTKGSQDPHFVEAKPSFMLKLSKADLLVSVGLGLEVGWLPSVLRGARNRKIMPGEKGSLILGNYINPLEVPQIEVTREHGDVHPEGNPHFMLGIANVVSLADKVLKVLVALDPAHKKAFTTNAQRFKAKMLNKLEYWKASIAKSGDKKLITYHKTLGYFLDQFNLESMGQIEIKPGIPASSAHILSLIKLCKSNQIPLILVENYFDDRAAMKIKKEVPATRVAVVPVAVDGAEGVNSLFDLYDTIAKAIISKKERG